VCSDDFSHCKQAEVRLEGSVLVALIHSGMYETCKGVKVNGKITATSEKAEYHSVFAGALEGSWRWRG